MFDHEEEGSHLYTMRGLQDKYRCTECSSNGVCYRQKHPDTGKLIHINLEPHIVSLWASKIVEGSAVLVGLPTHVEEFEKLIREALYPTKKKAGSHYSSSNGAFQGDVHVHNHTTVNVPSIKEPATPCDTKKPRKLPSTSICSPIHGFTAKDYKRRGLMAFIEWCEETYEDEEGDFRQAYTQLCEKKVGLDVLSDLSRRFDYWLQG
jgi:hypothetical protein